MASKRKHESSASYDKEETNSQWSKRQRSQGPSSNGNSKAGQPAADPTYGQRCAFPSLDDAASLGSDIELEDDGGAMEYLRSVRQEASTIPNLLVAPKVGPQLPPRRPDPLDMCYDDDDDGTYDYEAIDRSIYESGVGDTRGYYQDGAYTAAPDEESTDGGGGGSGSGDSDDPVRQAFYASLAASFTALRHQLRQTPPESVLAALPARHETFVGSFGPRSNTFRDWSHRLRSTDPLPAQVAAMDKVSTLRLLRVILGGKFLRRGVELRERTSRWIWSLLARLPDRGELDYTEVGYVRELGKRAVLMMASLAHVAALREHVGGLDEGTGDLDGMSSAYEEGGVEGGEHGEETWEEETDAAGCGVDSHPRRPEEEQQTDLSNPGEDGEAEMDISAASDELDTTPLPDGATAQADIEAAKARLLARLEEAQDANSGDDTGPVLEPELEAITEDDEAEADVMRARMNMRATLNMILTVAGEFYGQRDLLEFRDPFRGL